MDGPRGSFISGWRESHQGACVHTLPMSGFLLVQKTVSSCEQVYIYGCVDATINITGKCKMIAIDGCKKTKVSTALDAHLCPCIRQLLDLQPLPGSINQAARAADFSHEPWGVSRVAYCLRHPRSL